jgi:hypothetical protein
MKNLTGLNFTTDRYLIFIFLQATIWLRQGPLINVGIVDPGNPQWAAYFTAFTLQCVPSNDLGILTATATASRN